MRDQSGIRTPYCCLENDFTLTDAGAHAAMLERTLGEIALAARLGAEHVRLFAGFLPSGSMPEAVWQRMIAAFRVCQGVADRLGIRLAIETHGRITPLTDGVRHEYTVTTERAWLSRLLAELPEAIKINYDPGNLKAVAPNDDRLCLDLVNERVDYCHLKDWRPRGSGWEAVAIGDSDLDYGALIPKLHYRGVYLIEYEPTHDLVDGIRRSLDYLERLGFTLRFD